MIALTFIKIIKSEQAKLDHFYSNRVVRMVLVGFDSQSLTAR